MSQDQTQLQTSSITENKSVLMCSDQIQSSLDGTVLKMTSAQRQGNYTQAEECRILIEQLKKDLMEAKLKEAAAKHRKEKKDLEKSNRKQVEACKKFWAEKKEQLSNQSIETKEQTQKRHKNQLIQLEQQLQAELSTTFKQSSQCLDLRKKEENMAKQQKYVQAQMTHTRILKLQLMEKEEFAKQTKAKIQSAKQTLIQKQQKQFEAINKKMATALFQLEKDQSAELQKLRQKHQNSIKQQKSHQQKQNLSMKGQFKSKARLVSSASRSRLLTSRN